MAKLKATPKTFVEAAIELRGTDGSKKLGNNTWLERFADHTGVGIAVRLHDTRIVKFYQDGPITLHTGGYRTVTTKDRINEFIFGRIYQQDYTWYYISSPLAHGKEELKEFEDGMDVAVYGEAGQ